MKRKSIIHGLSIYLPLILVILTSGCAAARMYYRGGITERAGRSYKGK